MRIPKNNIHIQDKKKFFLKLLHKVNLFHDSPVV